ncbi:MAG: MlaD family protein [Polyangiaceae bacterium]|jgi:phospholipid/cholesterol/gamma-HCH transport system substrate-binding protein|nr:MlaD family protein [Polyangiaceae bacterium]
MSSQRDTAVGAFVLFGLVATSVVVITIGNERRVFDAKVQFETRFPDVQGLKEGAPVRLSGVDIGNVKRIEHSDRGDDDQLRVKIEVVRSEAVRIREDSIIRVANKGLLGDKMLEISPGKVGSKALPPGAFVKSEPPADYSNMLAEAKEIPGQARQALGNLEKVTASLAEEKTRQEMQQAIHSVTIILNNIAQGQGYASRLLNDPGEAEKISRAVGELSATTRKLNTTLDSVNAILERVKTGPGTAHGLIYENDSTRAVSQIGDAAGEVAVALRQVREGNGLAKGLLYGGPGQEKLSENLTAASADLRAIMKDVRAGKGTVGGLLVDPSIYEDMKSVLGNVQRNDVLRALVRYSIKQDEKKAPVTVEGGAPKP